MPYPCREIRVKFSKFHYHANFLTWTACSPGGVHFRIFAHENCRIYSNTLGIISLVKGVLMKWKEEGLKVKHDFFYLI